MPKDFRIKRFSFLSDEEDTGITAAEIESILNEHEESSFPAGRASWTVKELNALGEVIGEV